MRSMQFIERRSMCGKNLLLLTVFVLFPLQLQAHSPQQNDTATRPNILIIMTDQQFADVMSCAQGREYLHTPHMDSIAANGMRFTRAYAANPICCPSRTAMFTGRYPHETGVQDNGGAVDAEKFPILGKVFKDAGYDTGYTGKVHIYLDYEDRKKARFSENTVDIHGFDFLFQGRVNAADSARKGDWGRVWPGIEFLKKKRNKPFLLVVSCMNPHNICEWARMASKETFTKLPDGEIGTPPPLSQCPPMRENNQPPENQTPIMDYMRWSYQHVSTFPVWNFDEKKWREYIWAYYRMTEMVDAEIGKVLATLRETGQEENTLIVFVSDHGDCHGAHRWNQKTVFYDESSRVPLIVSWKGKTPQGTSDVLVNTGVDLFPTLCDLAGVTPPDGLPGRSLKGPALGKTSGWDREYVVAQNKLAQGRGIGKTRDEQIAGKLRPYGRMVRSDRYKYCVYSEGPQTVPAVDISTLSGEKKTLEEQRLLLRTTRQESLIDMENDPGEMNNLAKDPAYQEVLEQHRAYLEEFCRKHDDDFRAPEVTK